MKSIDIRINVFEYKFLGVHYMNFKLCGRMV